VTEAGPDPRVEEPSGAKAVLVYNLMRLSLLVGCAVIAYVVGLRGIWLVAAAFLASGVLSWFLLTRQRIAMGVAIERTVERGRAKAAARTAAEDDYADAVQPPDSSD
jgi:hypothetical protein